jgi:ABC-type glycerol-3-phosphate transport system substrate-binding protein
MAKKYEEIQSELYRRLSDGVYPLGTQLPPEQALAKEFGVNRNTLRQALSFLSDGGFLTRAPGRGTVVVAIPGPDSRPGRIKVLYRFFSESSESERCRTVEAVIRRFTELHPHIYVEAAPAPRTGALTAPSVPEMMGGPHATVLRCAYHAEYAKRGAMLPLDQFSDLVDAATALDGRLFYRTMNQAGDWHVHALPVQLAVWKMMGNRSLVEGLGLSMPDAQTTWDEFIELCEEITRRGKKENIRAIQLGIMDGIQTITRFLPYFYTANGGQRLVDPAVGEAHLNSPGNIKALEFLATLCQRDLCHLEPQSDAFQAGRAAFGLSMADTGIVYRQKSMPDSDVVALPFPLPSRDAVAHTAIHGDFVGVLSETIRSREERQAAWEFVKFLVSAEAQTIQFREGHLLPTRADLAPLVANEGGLLAQHLEYGLRHGVPTFDVPRNGDIHNIVRNAMVRAMRGECTAAQALAEGQELLQAYVCANQKELVASEIEPSMLM